MPRHGPTTQPSPPAARVKLQYVPVYYTTGGKYGRIVFQKAGVSGNWWRCSGGKKGDKMNLTQETAGAAGEKKGG